MEVGLNARLGRPSLGEVHLRAVPNQGEVDVRAIAGHLLHHVDQDVDALLLGHPRDHDDQDLTAVPEQLLAQGGGAADRHLGLGLHAEAHHRQPGGWRFAGDQLAAATVAHRDDPVGGEAGDLGELTDPLGFGAVVGDDNRDIESRCGQARDQGRRRLVGVDQVHRIALEPGPEPRGAARDAGEPGGHVGAEAGGVLGREGEEGRLDLGISPRTRGAGERNLVTAGAQPGAELYRVAGNAADAEGGAHLKDPQRPISAAVLREVGGWGGPDGGLHGCGWHILALQRLDGL